MILPRKFYQQDTITVAKELLGCFLISETENGKTAGKIVETEAYLGLKDPAAHSFKGQTERTKVMFGPPGFAYIYFIYGVCYCFNVVTQNEGVGEAVLIRALEPLVGIDLMKQRVGKDVITQLCNGPCKLVKAMGISRAQNGIDLTNPNLHIISRESGEKLDIGVSGRIGITKAADLPLRFFIKESKFLSVK